MTSNWNAFGVKPTRGKKGYMKARLSTVYSSIYGYLWKSMFRMSAQRVGILQPHPLSHKQYFSCSFRDCRARQRHTIMQE